MNLNVSFRHMDSSDALRTYIEEKSQKLEKYFHGRITVNWSLSVDKMLRVAHCHLVGNDMDYFGHSETEDMHASVDQAIDKLEKQLRKHKEIVKDHLHHPRDTDWQRTGSSS